MPTTNGMPDQAGTLRGLAQAPLHLQNMVAELIDNALAASAADQKVWVDLSQHPDGGDLYILRVWDNGPGIPDSIRETACPLHHQSPTNATGRFRHASDAADCSRTLLANLIQWENCRPSWK